MQRVKSLEFLLVCGMALHDLESNIISIDTLKHWLNKDIADKWIPIVKNLTVQSVSDAIPNRFQARYAKINPSMKVPSSRLELYMKESPKETLIQTVFVKGDRNQLSVQKMVAIARCGDGNSVYRKT